MSDMIASLTSSRYAPYYKIGGVTLLSLVAAVGIGAIVGGALKVLPSFSIPVGGSIILVDITLAAVALYYLKRKKPNEELNRKQFIEILQDKGHNKGLENAFNTFDNLVDPNLHLKTLEKVEELKKDKAYDKEQDKIVVNGKSYQHVNSKVSSFYGQSLFSYGKAREVILVEETDYLNKKYSQFYHFFKDTLDKNPGKDPHEVLFKCLIVYMHKAVFCSHSEKELGAFVKKYMSENNPPFVNGHPCIPMDALIHAHVGVCRHHVHVAANFLDRVFKHHPEIFEQEKLSVQIVNSKVNGGAHAWITVVSSTGTHWTLDTLNFIYGKLDDPKLNERIKKAFGEKPIDKQKRLANERYKSMK